MNEFSETPMTTDTPRAAPGKGWLLLLLAAVAAGMFALVEVHRVDVLQTAHQQDQTTIDGLSAQLRQQIALYQTQQAQFTQAVQTLQKRVQAAQAAARTAQQQALAAQQASDQFRQQQEVQQRDKFQRDEQQHPATRTWADTLLPPDVVEVLQSPAAAPAGSVRHPPPDAPSPH